MAERKRSEHNLTPGERAQLLAKYAMLESGRAGRRIGSAKLEEEFGVERNYVRHYLIPKALTCPENGLADLPRSGRSKVVTDAVAALLREHLEEVSWICAFRELAEFMKEDFDIQIC